MAKVKTKVIYRNKELEKKHNAIDKKKASEHKAHVKHDKENTPKEAHGMFKKSMAHLNKLTEKKK